jgi:hypothetical protein
MLRYLRAALLAAAFAFTISAASLALAAPATWESVDVTLHSESAGDTLLISGDLPPAAPLPAQAELSVPSGSQVQWVGEILGGAPSADPALEYEKSSAAGSDVYRFELTKARTAQVEVPLASAAPSGATTVSPALTWTATQAIPKVNMRVRIPEGAQIAQQVPGAVIEPGGSGFSLYTKTFTNVKPGDVLKLAFTYAAPAIAAGAPAAPPAAGAVQPTPSSNGGVVPVIVAILLIGVGVAVAVSVRGKLQRKGGEAGSGAKNATAQRSAQSRAGGSGGSSNSEARAGLTGATKRNLVTGGIVVTLVVLALVIGGQATKPKATGQTISKTFSQGAPCATATVAVVRTGSGDPAATADTLFKALDGVDGMNTGAYDAKSSSIEVGWCDSKTNKAAVLQALSVTGLIDTGAQPTTPAPAAGAVATPPSGG